MLQTKLKYWSHNIIEMLLRVGSNSKEKSGKNVISKLRKQERRNRLTKRLMGEKCRNKVHTITCTTT